MKSALYFGLGLLWVIAGFTGCQSGPGPLGPYRNMDKWLLGPGDDRRPLSGHPAAVTEYAYPAADSGQEERTGPYTEYRFDTSGNIVEKKVFNHDSLVMATAIRYDSNGMQESISGGAEGHSAAVSCRRLGDGRYKSIDTRAGGGLPAVLVSFPAGGQEVIREHYRDSAAKGDAMSRTHYYYDSGRLSRVLTFSNGAAVDEQYFYSKWGTPDSVRTYSGKTPALTQQISYVMNAHGDPARKIMTVGTDTLAVEAYAYRYDSAGNWTWELRMPVRVKAGLRVYDQPRITERVFRYTK